MQNYYIQKHIWTQYVTYKDKNGCTILYTKIKMDITCRWLPNTTPNDLVDICESTMLYTKIHMNVICCLLWIIESKVVVTGISKYIGFNPMIICFLCNMNCIFENSWRTFLHMSTKNIFR